MRRWHLSILSLVTAIGIATVPAAAQAHATGSPPNGTGLHRARATLATPAECAALRLHLGNPALDCSQLFTAHVAGYHSTASWTFRPPTRRPGAAVYSSSYQTGFLLACSDQNCSLTRPTSWEAEDIVAVTNITGVGVYNNSHACYPYGDLNPGITWCGTWHNGWTVMQEGENFGNNSYARMVINDNGTVTQVFGSSYAWLYGCLSTVPNGCAGSY